MRLSQWKTGLIASIATLALAPRARGQTAAAAAATATQPASRSFFDEFEFEKLLASNPLRRWLVLLGLIISAVVVGRIVTFLLQRVAARLSRRGWNSQAAVFDGLAAPANLAIFTLGLSIGIGQLHGLSPPLEEFNKRILLLLYTVSIFWYAFNLVSVLEVALKKITARTDTTLDDDLVPVIRKALRIFIVVIGALFILQNVFDRDIGAWLAGLGIAGLAVSLAAQDSLKNLFGSITILFDRPFSLGQRIKFQNFQGSVEEIGFRSTKVRTLDGTLVTIPNSNIVNDPVENWAVRTTFRRLFNVTITYNTPVAKVREAVDILRRLLDSDEFRGPINGTDARGEPDNPPRVHFTEFNPENLNVQVVYWYRPATDWWAFLEHSQRLNLRLMEEFEKAGIEFAFPTRTVFLAGDAQRPLAVEMVGRNPDKP